MTQTEALTLALEALEEVQKHQDTSDWFNEKVIAVRKALAQPEHKPVACVQDLGEVKRKHLVYEKGMDWKDPLYTTPPQRKPLTHEQRIQIVKDNTVQGYHGDYFDAWGIIDDVEAAQGIKE